MDEFDEAVEVFGDLLEVFMVVSAGSREKKAGFKRY